MFDILDKNKNGKFEVSEAAEIVKLCAKIAAEASPSCVLVFVLASCSSLPTYLWAG